MTAQSPGTARNAVIVGMGVCVCMLSAWFLLRARALHLVVTGEAKREVLAEAMARNDPLHHPVAAILHAPEALVHIHWSP